MLAPRSLGTGSQASPERRKTRLLVAYASARLSTPRSDQGTMRTSSRTTAAPNSRVWTATVVVGPASEGDDVGDVPCWVKWTSASPSSRGSTMYELASLPSSGNSDSAFGVNWVFSIARVVEPLLSTFIVP